jgi:hypothetical protein
LQGIAAGVHEDSIKTTLNEILRNWRELWPGGLREDPYSTLNLMAHCRAGSPGYNQAKCGGCPGANESRPLGAWVLVPSNPQGHVT